MRKNLVARFNDLERRINDSLSIAIRAMEQVMAAKAPSVKRYVVRLSAEERQQLETLIRKGKSLAQRLLKARILLKADVSPGRPWKRWSPEPR